MKTINKRPRRHKIEELLPWHATGTLSHRDADSIADETAYFAIETRVVDRGQSVPSGQRNDQIAMRGRRRTARDNEATVAGEEDRPRDRQVAVDLRLRSTRAETCTRLRGDTRSGDGGVR